MVERTHKVAPTGSKIIGTAEMLLCTALIVWCPEDEVAGDKRSVYDYYGETEVDWDSQEQCKDGRGQLLFTDENGFDWPEDQLLWNDEWETRQVKLEDPKPASDGFVEDKNFPLADWQYEVANGDTRRGYVEWVKVKREELLHQKDMVFEAKIDADIRRETGI